MSTSDPNNVRVAVIGAGMSGILTAIRLQELGIEFSVFEKADRIGGTWRENTYPGLSCDVPSHAYTYSFARNPDWSRWYAPGPEIQAYFQKVADDNGVTELVRFGDEVTSLEFDDGAWELRTAGGYAGRFEAVVAATGVLHHPNVPDIPGLERFAGACFHSARWDHSVPLEGRRVGVIGTGSTAVQITTALIDDVEQFTLFQRTAQWIMPGDAKVFTDEEKAAYRDDPGKLEQFVAQVKDSMRVGISQAVIDADSVQLRKIEHLCEKNLNTVRDPELRERLRPTYRAACKRLIFSPDFYDAIQKPNAVLVTDPIERIEPEGVRTRDGVLHRLDVLVLATGFQVDRFVRPIRVIGRDGVDLNDAWADGPLAYISVTVPGFPNFFMLNGPNGPVGNFSLIDVAELQLNYSLQLIEALRDGRCRELSPTPEATAAFEAERRAAASHTVWSSGCNSWYLDRDGVPATWTFSWDRFCEEMNAPKWEAFSLR
ncbi:MAG: NAD(P)/FAD-dependent oxidoreductase [Acidimicrobiales bacterium]|nr:NAD(P)/FAD-dependent oxidoreductase [Acidimicrobiales bacterium]